MINYKSNLDDCVSALIESAKKSDNLEFSDNFVREKIKNLEYYAIYDDEDLVGAMYFNGDCLHIGMIKKGLGWQAIKKVSEGRTVLAIIQNTNERVIKLVKFLGFKDQYKTDKYTYLVKTCHS